MRVAVIQLVSSKNIDSNLNVVASQIELASSKGADIVVLPENFALFGQGYVRSSAELEVCGSGPIHTFLIDQAKRYGVWIIGGTVPYPEASNGRIAEPGKAFASVPVISDMGDIVARYEKIHLFDAVVDDDIGGYQESDYLSPGSDPVVVDTPWGKLGIAVCYDLRFPEYFRKLVDLGAEIVAIPSAFTYATGKDHWIPLVQARAIENQVFVLAANQGGRHDKERRTWGHSCILGPWGNCIAACEEGEALVIATINFEEIKKVRRQMPLHKHRKF